MAASFIRQLLDEAKNKVYPVTTAKAVYINKTDTVERMLNDLDNKNGTIEFKPNEIVQTKASGAVVTITFKGNTIEEETKSSDGRLIKTKKTTINEDGTIDISTQETGEWDMMIDSTTDLQSS